MVLLVCFLVAKLSDTNLLVLKKKKQPQSLFLKLYNLPSFDALNHSFQLDPSEQRWLCTFSLHMSAQDWVLPTSTLCTYWNT